MNFKSWTVELGTILDEQDTGHSGVNSLRILMSQTAYIILTCRLHTCTCTQGIVV